MPEPTPQPTPDPKPVANPNGDALRDRRTYARELRLRHGADAWIMEWLAPLRDVRFGRVSVGDAADVATFCWRHLREDRAAQIAAALAFRTLFGLLPVLVVVTLIAKAALGADFLPWVERFLEGIGAASVHLKMTSADGTASSSVSLSEWLMQLVRYANTVNITAIGWGGFILLAFSAIWVLVTIEEAFNVIYRCETGRSWLRRTLVYWFVLTLGPVVIVVAFILFQRIDQLASHIEGWEWVTSILRFLVSLAAMWVPLAIGYLTIPATRVAWRPAMIGAIVGAVLLEIGKRTFGLYLANAMSVSALYGSLGLVPLFMFWVYLMWLVILFGAEIAALLQAIRGRDRASESAMEADGEAALRATQAVADAFARGATLPLAVIASAARLPVHSASLLLVRLEDAGFVRKLGEEDAYSLARPADSIRLAEVLTLAWRSRDASATPNPLEAKLRSAQLRALGEATLAAPSLTS